MATADLGRKDGETALINDPVDPNHPRMAKGITPDEHSHAMAWVKVSRFNQGLRGYETEREELSAQENIEVYHNHILRQRGLPHVAQPSPIAAAPTNSGESFHTGRSQQQINHQQLQSSYQLYGPGQQQQYPYTPNNYQMQGQGQQQQLTPHFYAGQDEGDSFGNGGAEYYNRAPPGGPHQYYDQTQHWTEPNSNTAHNNQLWAHPGGGNQYTNQVQYRMDPSSNNTAPPGSRPNQYSSRAPQHGEKRSYNKPKTREEDADDKMHAAYQEAVEGVMRKGVAEGKFGVNEYLTARIAKYTAPPEKTLPCWYHCHLNPRFMHMSNVHSEENCNILSRMDPKEVEREKKAWDSKQKARGDEREKKRLQLEKAADGEGAPQ